MIWRQQIQNLQRFHWKYAVESEKDRSIWNFRHLEDYTMEERILAEEKIQHQKTYQQTE